jgi:polyhydroxybutyrate depolymerase
MTTGPRVPRIPRIPRDPRPRDPRRMGVLGAALAIIALPVVLVPIEAVSYYVRNANNGSIVSLGQTRDYLLHVPASYDRAKPTPLVISLHGGALWGAAQKEISQWNPVADREGFIVVYPSGAMNNGPGHWRMGDRAGRDVAFISDLIDKLSADYNIDPARIYANGLSNGGGMSFVLSCTLSNRIAAVGMVNAAQLLPWSWCTDTRPVPMITFHGTADPVVPYTGGKTWVAPQTFPHVPMWTANWAKRNRCAPEPVDSLVAANVTRRAYNGCANDASVELYTVGGGGHDWPGGAPLPEWLSGPVSRGIDATSQMWAFFRRHHLSTE